MVRSASDCLAECVAEREQLREQLEQAHDAIAKLQELHVRSLKDNRLLADELQLLRRRQQEARRELLAISKLGADCTPYTDYRTLRELAEKMGANE